MRKTGIWNALKHDMEDTIKKLTKIHTSYKETKMHVDVWRNDLVESLDKVEKNDTTVEVERKKLMTVS
jgi:hypothetical protein